MQRITKSPSYLIRNPSSYCFRINVPKDLQPLIGRKELRRSLKTGYLRTAKSKARLIAGRLQEVFQVVRESMDNGGLPLHEIEAIIERAFRDLVNFNERMKAWTGQITPEDRKLERSKHQMSLESAKDALASNDYSRIRDDFSNMFGRSSDALFSDETDPTELKQLYRSYLKVKIRYHQLELERLAGEFSTDPESVFHADIDLKEAKTNQSKQERIENERHLAEIERAESLSDLRNELARLKGITGSVAVNSGKEEEPSILLSELYEQFKAEKVEARRWGNTTIRNHTPKINALVQFVDDVPVNQITKPMLRKYRKLLDHLPPNFVKKGYPDLSVVDPKDLAGKHDETLDITTVREYMNFTKSLFQFAKDNDYIGENPVVSGMIPPKKKNTRELRHPFVDPSELAQVFDKERFLKWSEEKPERFWVPILALFTGCRMEEMCQLYVDDVKQVDGIWCIDIKGLTGGNGEGEEGRQMLKNENASRIVPLHPILVKDLKFPDYVNDLMSSSGSLIFSHLEKSKKTNWKYSQALSKAFGRYLRNKARISDKKKAFHSFRHTVANHLYNTVFDESIIEELEGRAGKTETRKTYTQGYQAKVLYEQAILKLNYKVDLSHLKDSKWVPKDTDGLE